MRWLIWRELLVVTRTPAFWLAMAFYLLVLTIYVLTWGDGIPVADAAPSLQQFAAFQGVLLLTVLPWAAARCGTARRSDLTLVASLTALRPSQVVLARCLALVAALFLLAASALPLMVVMQQLTASRLTSVAAAIPTLIALSIFAAVAITALLLVADTLHVWMGATALALIAVRLISLNPVAWLAVALSLGALAALTADRRLTYLPDNETA